jgi:hypothetical protein
MLNPENSASSNFVSPELKEWVPAEFEAGYAARFVDVGMTPCWRVGREDANTELFESARQNRPIVEGREVQGDLVHPLRHWWRRPCAWNQIR